MTLGARHAGLLLALHLAGGAMLLAASPARSACVPNGPTVPSGSTVNCTGTDTTGVGDGTQNNVTVTVQPGASITLGDNAIDIQLNDNNVVTNNGTIAAGINSFGIQVRSNNSITNNGAITLGAGSVGIRAFGNDAVVNTGSAFINGIGIGIETSGLNSPIINSGTVTLAAGGTGLEAIGGNNTPISNSGAITLLSGTGTGIFIAGDNSAVTNSGAITFGNGGGRGIFTLGVNSGIANSGAITMSAVGIGLLTTRANSAITNSGAVGINGDGSVGLETDAAGSPITNSGIIRLPGANGIGILTNAANSGVVNSGAINVASGIGIQAFGTNSGVTNSGTITVGGDGSLGIIGGLGSSVVNSGTVQMTGTHSQGIVSFGSVSNSGTVIVGTGVGIQATASGVSVVNSGLVRARDTGAGLTASLLVNGGNSTVFNTGILDGRVQIIGAGNVFTNSGLVAITSDAAAFGPNYNVVGTFTQTAAGTLGLRVTNAGAYDSMQATSTANLGGTLGAVVQPGLYANSTSYFGVLTAGNPIASTFAHTLPFAAGTTTPLTFFTLTPTYNPNSVDLTLNRVPFGAVPGETQNQRGVGNALEAAYATTLTGQRASLFTMLLQSTSLAVLDPLSGEAATGGQRAAFQLGNQFLAVMLDPFVDGRGGVDGVLSGGAVSFAPEQPALPERMALAYASVMKAPVTKAAPFEARWSVWGSAYGGSNRTSGDLFGVGSHDLAAHVAGFATGMDYHLTRDTVLGFAIAGGGTNWSLAQGFGGGRSDAFQAGVYGTTRWGPAYVAASLAFTNHWMSTDRFALAGDHLTAGFNAQSFGARVESGYRIASAFAAFTPYAALQAQAFHTPGYAETDVNGGGFGLAYAARTTTDTRSELGARIDKTLLLDSGALLALRSRLAWAHNWVSDPTLAAVFQTLPGGSFIVNGATPAKDSALVSAGAELRLANGVSLLGKVDGELASHATTYAGTGTVRVNW
jgi:uncharacterized protein with beta-barrel porin domain